MEAINQQNTLRSAYSLLKLTYGIVPIVAGLDKFTNLLAHWDQYISTGMAGMLPFTPAVFMMIVGVIEIAAGILVLSKPAIGGLVVAAWLALIALTLIFSGAYIDVAVRDLVMGIGAFVMARLSRIVL